MALAVASRRHRADSLRLTDEAVSRRYLLRTATITAPEVTSIHRYSESDGEPSIVIRAGWFRQIAIPADALDVLHHRLTFGQFVRSAQAAGAVVDERVGISF